MLNRCFVAALAGFYPAFFYLSNNWHIFSFEQKLFLLTGVTFISIGLLIGISYLLDFVLTLTCGIRYFSENGPYKKESVLNSIVTFLSIIFCFYLLRNTLLSIKFHIISKFVIIVLITLFLTWTSYKKGLKLILSFFIVFTLLSMVSLTVNILSNNKVPIEVWSVKNKAIYDQIKFKKKKNVHLIITESYPNYPALRAVYNINNDEFYRKLRENGLKINHDHFSNYNHTLSSLPSMFCMTHHYGIFDGANLDSVGGRRILEAKIYNPVIDIFRSNNYQIQYLHNISGLIPNGAGVDFYIPKSSCFQGLKVFMTHQNVVENSNLKKNSASIESIKKYIYAASQKDDYYFNFIYLNFPGHSPSRIKNRSRKVLNSKLSQFRHDYVKKIESANKKLIGLLEHIKNVDPDSIIVIVGDHGSRGYRFKRDSQGQIVSNKLFILDRFGVLAAIRGPVQLAQLIENGTIKSHVNLFKYIFAYLSEDNLILETLEPDDSYDRAFIMAIKNGKILDDFVRIKLSKSK